MHIILNIVVFFCSILALITVHEFGHFIVAKLLKVKVVRFSVGFGKALWKHQAKSGTEYQIAWLPLGGYVKLLDENEAPVPPQDQPRAFNRQALWKRASIVLAGPGINILFAILAFWMVAFIGKDEVKPIIGAILPNTPAAIAQLPPKSEIVALNDQPVHSWQKISMKLIERFGSTGNLPITVRDKKGTQRYLLPLQEWSPKDELQPDPLASLGIEPYQLFIPPVIHRIVPDGPAAHSNLRLNDRILAINGKPVKSWMDFVQILRQYPKQTLSLTVQRGSKMGDVTVKTGRRLGGYQWIGYLGVEPLKPEWPADMQYNIYYAPWPALKYAARETYDFSVFHFVVLGKMITGEISFRGIGGPISIYETTSLAFSQGLPIYLGFLGILSVMLACVNILPIPGLDGGHLLFYVFEAILGRPLSLRWQMLILRLGFIVLILIMVQATVNDVLRWFS
ncbi:MAG: RIP metalloprotease RseP [Gammaproteobacteria bacterium]